MKEETPKSTLYLFPIILIVFALLIYIFYLSEEDGREYLKKIHAEFIEPSFKESVRGKVIYLEPDYPGINSAGVSLVILDSGQKVWLNASYNWDYTPLLLRDNIKLGDSIFKKPFSDTIYLYGESTQVYVLGKSINYKGRKSKK